MYSLRPMKREDLDMVLKWRNQKEVRMNMYTTHVISKEEHYSWFERVSIDPSKRYFICEDDFEPVGVVAFMEINEESKTACWAFYSSNLKKRGVGSAMETLALQYAFKDLHLEKLWCEVLSHNYPVVSFHRKFGFRIEGVFKRQHFDGSEYKDIYRLALFRKDWERMQNFAEVNAKEVPFRAGARYSETFTIRKEQIRKYADLVGDHNPVHLDKNAAKALGFDNVISHGILAGSVFSKIFGTQFPGSGTIYLSQSLQFKKPVYPDEEHEVKLKVATRVGNRAIIETNLMNSTKEVVLSGEAEVILPDDI